MSTHDPYGVSIELIDRAKAQEYLLLNTHNRPVAATRVRALAGKMTRGEWMFTGQAHVIISNEKVLLNGQHTLLAVVEADTIIETLVVTGVDPAAFAKIDIGWKRTVGNVLAIAGAANSDSLASVVRLTMVYDELKRNENGKWITLSAVEADRLLPVYESDPDAFGVSATFGKSTCQAARASGVHTTTSAVGAFRYLAVRQGHDPDGVEQFGRRVAADVGHADLADPALSLRRWLIKTGPNKGGNSADRGLSVLSAWIKAYLAAEHGTPLSKIYAWTRETPDFPRL